MAVCQIFWFMTLTTRFSLSIFSTLISGNPTSERGVSRPTGYRDFLVGTGVMVGVSVGVIVTVGVGVMVGVSAGWIGAGSSLGVGVVRKGMAGSGPHPEDRAR